MSVIVARQKKKQKLPEPVQEERFRSDQAYEEFRVKSAAEKLGYRPKRSISLTPEESRLVDSRWKKMRKKDLSDPCKNADLMPEKGIIEERD